VLVVAQPGLNRAAVVVDDGLGLVGLERVERGRRDRRRRNLFRFESGGQVGGG
jgi:hypothetical protein